MSSTIDFGTYLITFMIVSVIAVAFIGSSAQVMESRGVIVTTNLANENNLFHESQNVSSTIADNLRETGIEDESSQSKIISLAWNGLKLFMRLPKIMLGMTSSLAETLGLSLTGFSIVALISSILVVAVIWTLIRMIILGGIR